MAEAAERPLQGEGKKENGKGEKQEGLEHKVNRHFGIVKGAANIVLGAAAIGGSYALYGLDGLVLSSSFPIGRWIYDSTKAKKNKDEKTSFTATFRDESISGALFTVPTKIGLDATYNVPKAYGLDGMVTDIFGYTVPVSPLVVAGVTGLILNPLLNAVYYPLKYVVQNKTFKGVGEDFKKNYVSSLIRTAPLSIITSIAVGLAYAMPAFAPLLFPYFALSSIAYRVFMSPKKINYAKPSYAKPALTPAPST